MKSVENQSRDNHIIQLMQRIGYRFSDTKLLDLALSHRSIGDKNNERLEFLGDAILNFVIGKILYEKFSQAQEGQLSRLRAGLVKGITLAEVGKELLIGETLRLGAGERKAGGQRRESILADAVEAIIGAIYLDSDMDTCEQCILEWFTSRLQTLNPNVNQKDAKTQLQEFLQARKQELPMYKLLQTKGQDHQQTFVMSCYVGLLGEVTRAEASSRRLGEQKSAAIALQRLQAQDHD